MNLPFLIEILNILDKIRAVLSVTQLSILFGMLLGPVDFDWSMLLIILEISSLSVG